LCPALRKAVGGGWYPYVMKKTSLYIDPEVDRALERRAAAEGITKAELVRRVLAARLQTTRVATLDERHFRALGPLTGEAAFTLLPADA
jgi:hypothetical protein